MLPGASNWFDGTYCPSKCDLVQRLAVDRERESLAHARIAAERRVGGLAVGDVELDRHETERGAAEDAQLRVFADRGDVGRRDFLGDVERARLEVHFADIGIGDGAEQHARDPDRLRVPVAGETLERDVVLRHAILECERAGADGVLADLVGRQVQELRGIGRAGTVREQKDQRREGTRDIDAQRVRIDHLGAGDGFHLRLADRIGRRLVALDIGGDGRGIERRAVLEGDALAQMHRQRQAIRRPLPRRREFGDKFQLGRQIDEAVAHQRGDDAVGVAAVGGGIEEVGSNSSATRSGGSSARAGGAIGSSVSSKNVHRNRIAPLPYAAAISGNSPSIVQRCMRRTYLVSSNSVAQCCVQRLSHSTASCSRQ